MRRHDPVPSETWGPMLRSARRRIAAAAAVSTLVLAGGACGGDSIEPRAAGDTDRFVRLFDGFSADYEPANSPKQLAEWSELVVSGSIEKVSDGRVHGDENEPLSAAPTISVQVKVTNARKGTLPDGSDGRVHVEFYATHGRKAAEYDRVAPRDVEVLLYLNRSPAAGTKTNPIQHPDRGRPDGQPLWRLTTPQGFLMKSDEGVVAVQDFRRYEGTSMDMFFPGEERFPPNPDQSPEDDER